VEQKLHCGQQVTGGKSKFVYTIGDDHGSSQPDGRSGSVEGPRERPIHVVKEIITMQVSEFFPVDIIRA
jgi:hypothetical protein